MPQSFDMGMLLEELQKTEDQPSAAKSMAGKGTTFLPEFLHGLLILRMIFFSSVEIMRFFYRMTFKDI